MPTLKSISKMAFWLRPGFPQYRKIVGGKMKKLTGKETNLSEVVCFYSTGEFEKLILKENQFRDFALKNGKPTKIKLPPPNMAMQKRAKAFWEKQVAILKSRVKKAK